MSLLLKALKKAERENQRALENAEEAPDLQAPPPVSSDAPASSNPPMQRESLTQPEPDSTAPPERRPLSLTEDHTHQHGLPAFEPALETPRHSPESPPTAPAPPLQTLSTNAAEPRLSPHESFATATGTHSANNAPHESNNQQRQTSQFAVPSQTSRNATDSNSPIEAVGAIDASERAQPLQLTGARKAPKILLWSSCLLALIAGATWFGLQYLDSTTQLFSSPQPMSERNGLPILASGTRTPEQITTGLDESNAPIDSDTARGLNNSNSDQLSQPGSDSTQQTDKQENSSPVSTSKKKAGGGTAATKPAPTPAAPTQSGPRKSLTIAPRAPKRSTVAPTAERSKRVVADSPALPPVRFVRAQNAREKKLALLNNAYRNLRNGNLDEAKSGYRDALRIDKNLSDAWIGLATIAARNDDVATAEQHFRRAIRINPNDSVARAGLATLVANPDPVSQESRLRNLIAREESNPAIKFSLGNSLASQGRWAEAQQAYFEASSAEPDQPNYAFNLAVSLEQLRQPAAAIAHYRRAVNAAGKSPANFDPAQAQARIDRLLSDSSAGGS